MLKKEDFMMPKIFLMTATFLLPFIITKLEKKLKLIEWLSPVVCCYALGILLGNGLGTFWEQDLARSLSEVSVMLALPMLLFSTDLLGWFKLAKKTLISFAFVILSVMVSAYVAGRIFYGADPEVWKMAGMMVGVYTGGTPNLMAIGKALEVREDVFVMLNAVDVVLGGAYLLFIMSVGVKLLGRFLPPFDYSQANEEDASLLNWSHLSLKRKSLHSLILFILGAVSVGLALLLSKLLTGGESVSVIILGLTLIAILFSFSPKIRHFEGSQELGQYLLLVFCVAVGSLAKTSQMGTGSLWYFLFCATVMFGSIFLHFLCCFFLKIDRDTAIITSMAGIFGPAFVAPMSQVLKNRAILFSGVTTGLVGYAVGNFVGILIAYLLKG
jgi:uncharacterized membrane protein